MTKLTQPSGLTFSDGTSFSDGAGFRHAKQDEKSSPSQPSNDQHLTTRANQPKDKQA